MAHCLQLIFSSALGGPLEIKEICGRGSKTQSNECTPWNLFLVSINIIKSITHLLSCSINDPLLNTVIIVIWTEQHTHICHSTTRQIFPFCRNKLTGSTVSVQKDLLSSWEKNEQKSSGQSSQGVAADKHRREAFPWVRGALCSQRLEVQHPQPSLGMS